MLEIEFLSEVHSPILPEQQDAALVAVKHRVSPCVEARFYMRFTPSNLAIGAILRRCLRLLPIVTVFTLSLALLAGVGCATKPVTMGGATSGSLGEAKALAEDLGHDLDDLTILVLPPGLPLLNSAKLTAAAVQTSLHMAAARHEQDMAECAKKDGRITELETDDRTHWFTSHVRFWGKITTGALVGLLLFIPSIWPLILMLVRGAFGGAVSIVRGSFQTGKP